MYDEIHVAPTAERVEKRAGTKDQEEGCTERIKEQIKEQTRDQSIEQSINMPKPFSG